MTLPQTGPREASPSAPVHQVPAPGGLFDLAREVAELRSQPQYQSTGQAARTLVKRQELRIVLIVLRKDAEMKEHRTNHPVSIQALVGRMRVTMPDRSVEQVASALLVIEPDVCHDILALTDCALLLSMSWSDQAED
jgi:quercetin dioxygenase-like cupin family protein